MKVSIERFKNIEHIDCDFDSEITLLVGSNNAGKSTILQAMQFAVSIAQTAKLQSGRWSGNSLGTSVGQSDVFYTPIKDLNALAFNRNLTQDKGIKIAYEYCGDNFTASIKKGKNKNISINLRGKKLGEELQKIDKPFAILVTGLAGIPSEENFQTNIVIRKTSAKGNSNAFFRNILWQLKKTELNKWNQFKTQLRQIFPTLDIDVSFDENQDETIKCTLIKGGVSLPIDSCGTGVLQAIQIFSYVHLFAPKLLLLDEPDSHLHPNNQRLLAQELLKLAENGTKIIISTHSSHLIDGFDNQAELKWVENGKIRDNQPDYEINCLLSIGALSSAERIASKKFVVLTEDADIKPIKILLEANNFELDKTEVLSYGGCTQLGTVDVLLKYLKKTNPMAIYVVHRDRDFMKEEEVRQYSQQISNQGATAFVTKQNDLESYFLGSHHIAYVAGLEISEARKIRNECIDDNRNEFVEKYVNTRMETLRKLKQETNAGKIAVEANNLKNFEFVHGKMLCGKLSHKLQNLGLKHRLITKSPHLNIPELSSLMVKKNSICNPHNTP